jgi:hypothetical protein
MTRTCSPTPRPTEALARSMPTAVMLPRRRGAHRRPEGGGDRRRAQRTIQWQWSTSIAGSTRSRTARGRCFDHPAGEHQPHLHHCRAPLGQRLPMPSRSHLALRRVAASDRQPSTGCPQGRDGGRVQRGTAGRLSVGSAPDVGRVCTSPYRELAPRTEDTRGLPRLGMYYRNLLTTQTSERGATGQARPSSAAGTVTWRAPARRSSWRR